MCTRNAAASACLWLWLAALPCAGPLACDRADEAPPEQAVAALPRSFELRGAPGPWWRAGATQPDFDAESRSCLAESRAARERSAPDAKADAAYRAFLDCMEARSWRRGAQTRAPGLTPPAR